MRMNARIPLSSNWHDTIHTQTINNDLRFRLNTGLRGAVAFALALLIKPERVEAQPMFVTTTIAVIYFTVFVQGITIKPLVKILNVKRASKKKPTMNERIHERVRVCVCLCFGYRCSTHKSQTSEFQLIFILRNSYAVNWSSDGRHGRHRRQNWQL